MGTAKVKKRTRDLGAVSVPSEIIMHILVGGFALCCIIPFAFVFMVSITDEMTLAKEGFRLIPSKFSFAAYEYLIKSGDQIIRSFGVSVFITIVGTILCLLITILYAYALFRKDFKFRKFFTFFAFFTMLFGGGLVPTYMVARNMLGLSNNIQALIIPLLVSPYNFIILRTFFTSSVPESLIESAMIDGSGEYRTLFQIIIPISLPGIATIGLFAALGYWNDWFTAMLYVDKPDLIPLQYLLMKIERKVDFITQNSALLSGAEMLEASKGLPRESMKMALVVLVVVPIACAYPFFQRYFISGLTVGAVKG